MPGRDAALGRVDGHEPSGRNSLPPAILGISSGFNVGLMRFHLSNVAIMWDICCGFNLGLMGFDVGFSVNFMWISCGFHVDFMEV